MDKRQENYAVVSWVIALVATLGSLYFSEIRNFEPCQLCWYQRILMYPLVIIYIIGIVLKDGNVFKYGAVLSFIGLGTASYHYAIQKLPFLQDSAPTCGQVGCTSAYINWGGFITIPFLALVAFLIIFVVNVIAWKNTRED
ncbi:disulfide oxidoreductase [Halalkalibacillus halophilus]|uniref:disulfide oxidoreductase n=1 Tax=Halalkalibacillus halophilus TaxID=392827 RepID=UPI000417E80C|nr:disulfide oxidoreductase [Halalkalibacillus halophilus]